MPSIVPLLGRFGLLATTVAMGIALVATGVAGYSGAKAAAAALVQSRSLDVALSVRRELNLAGALDPATLDGVVSELAELEVVYLAVFDPHGALVASSGQPGGPAEAGWAPSHPSAGPRMEWRWAGDRVRVVAAAGLPGRGMMGPGRGPPGGGPPGLGRGPGRGPAFVVEYVPGPARTLVSRALATLVLSGAAAALLLAVALVSWRQAREAERLTGQLARDQQLKSLGQMSAVLSHELRNPLTALKGHAQLLAERLPADHPGRAGAERVVAGALRLEAIANQILDFARPGAVAPRAEDPGAVAQAAIDLVADPRVRLSVEPGLGSWSLDRLRLEQLLVNLLRNAAEASPETAPVEVSVGREASALVFAVRDHGPGLPPGEEARIFEPFFGRRVRGTGLGLAIARQIAEAHGGHLEGATHPDGGALFRVVLPPREAGRS